MKTNKFLMQIKIQHSADIGCLTYVCIIITVSIIILPSVDIFLGDSKFMKNHRNAYRSLVCAVRAWQAVVK